MKSDIGNSPHHLSKSKYRGRKSRKSKVLQEIVNYWVMLSG